MMFKRCRVCNFRKNNNRCYFKTAQDKAEGDHYHLLSHMDICPMTEMPLEKYIKPKKVKTPKPKSAIRIRRENAIEIRKELKKRAKELRGK